MNKLNEKVNKVLSPRFVKVIMTVTFLTYLIDDRADFPTTVLLRDTRWLHLKQVC